MVPTLLLSLAVAATSTPSFDSQVAGLRAATPPTTPGDKDPFRPAQWMIHAGVGVDVSTYLGHTYGPALQFGGWANRWRGRFFVAAGPMLQYSYLQQAVGPNRRRFHFATVNGDLLLGGGDYRRFAVYAHLRAGLGYLAVRDRAATGFAGPGFRLSAGVGCFVHVTPEISLGTQSSMVATSNFALDFAGHGGAAFEQLLTINIHFGEGVKTTNDDL